MEKIPFLLTVWTVSVFIQYVIFNFIICDIIMKKIIPSKIHKINLIVMIFGFICYDLLQYKVSGNYIIYLPTSPESAPDILSLPFMACFCFVVFSAFQFGIEKSVRDKSSENKL